MFDEDKTPVGTRHGRIRDVLVLGSSGTIGGAVTKELMLAGANVHKPGRDFQWEHAPNNPWGLVCCFGSYGPLGKLEDVMPSEIYQSLFLNVFTQMIQVREFIKLLDGRPGRIVLMSGGGVGSGQFPRGRSSYVAAKHAIVGFVQAMSKELTNITINAVAPGPVSSKMTQNDIRSDWVSPGLAAELVTKLIMRDDESETTGFLINAQTGKEYVLMGDEVYAS